MFTRSQRILILVLLISLSFFDLLSQESKQVSLFFFYETGCPHCARVDRFLRERIIAAYPVQIDSFEVHVPENARRLNRYASHFNVELKTPVVVIGDTLIKGDTRESFRDIEAAVRRAIRENQLSPVLILDKHSDIKNTVTIPAVIVAAAVDAVNPCAFAVLTLLLGTILVARKNRSQVIKAGIAFTISTYISYLLMGLGLFAVIRISGLERIIYIVVAILAILIGIVNIKDYFWYGKGFSLEMPEKWRPKVKNITSGVTSVAGAFGIGFIVSLFLLPCSSGPYIVIIGMLSNSATRVQSILLLILYNLVFILPFLLITFAVGYGLTTTARVERLRQEKLKKLHLATGIGMFIIGLGLVFIVVTGNV